jgi:acetoin utilization protein AcuC
MNLLVYSERLAQFRYGEDHPFKPLRAKLFFELLQRYTLIGPEDIVLEPFAREEEILLLFHEREYVDALRRAETEYSLETYRRGIGTEDNPVFKGMFEFSLLCASATLEAAEKVALEGARLAFCPTAGFHHAERGRAFGFCYVNDVAIAGRYLLDRGYRIAILDIDAHHGNGVQDAFYEEDRVLTISIHESGATLFPGTGSEEEIGSGRGYGFNVNIPLAAGTGDEAYLFAFESIVPPLLYSFQPQVLFALLGCDTHRHDPLSHLNLSASAYRRLIERISGLSGHILALGAGGYNIFKTAAMWTIAWASLLGRKIEDPYTGLVGGMMYGPEIDIARLSEEVFEGPLDERERCMHWAERVVRWIREHVFPIHGLTS